MGQSYFDDAAQEENWALHTYPLGEAGTSSVISEPSGDESLTSLFKEFVQLDMMFNPLQM